MPVPRSSESKRGTESGRREMDGESNNASDTTEPGLRSIPRVPRGRVADFPIRNTTRPTSPRTWPHGALTQAKPLLFRSHRSPRRGRLALSASARCPDSRARCPLLWVTYTTCSRRSQCSGLFSMHSVIFAAARPNNHSFRPLPRQASLSLRTSCAHQQHGSPSVTSTLDFIRRPSTLFFTTSLRG